MTIVTKREPENPWDGVKLIVGVKRYYTKMIMRWTIPIIRRVNLLK